MDKTIILSVILLGWISGVYVQRSRTPPQITDPPTEVYNAPAGSPFSLQCVAPINTRLVWYFENRQVYDNRHSQYTIRDMPNYGEQQRFSTLTTKQSASDMLSGEYRCQDENNRQSFDSVRVTVTSMSLGGGSYGGSSYGRGSDSGYDAGSSYDSGMSRSTVDIVSPHGDTLSVQESRDMSLECRGPGTSTLTWYKDNRQLYEGSSYAITVRMDYSTNKRISIISNKRPASASLSGEYKCQDANDRNQYDQVNVQVGRQVNWGNGANVGYDQSTPQTGGGGALGSKPLIFSTILFEPYLMENEDRHAVGNNRFIGFIPDLVKELAKRLDFEYELRLVKDSKWGARDQSTGQWNGMIGEVIRGEVDFAAAPITVNDIRKSVVDFTIAFQDVGLTALVKAGSKLQTLDDLLSSNLTYGTIRGGATYNALMGTRTPQLSPLYSKIVSHDGMVETTEEGHRRAVAGGYAFVTETPIADYLVAQDCSIEKTEKFMDLPGFAFPAQKHYRDMAKINRALTELKKDGKIQALIDTWWAPQPCSACRGVLLSSVLLLTSLLLSVFL